MKAKSNLLKGNRLWRRWYAKAIYLKKFARLVSALMLGAKNGHVIGIISAIALSAVNQRPNGQNSIIR